MRLLKLVAVASAMILPIGPVTAGTAQDAGLIFCVAQQADLEDDNWLVRGVDPNASQYLQAVYPGRSFGITPESGPRVVEQLRRNAEPPLDGLVLWDDNIAHNGEFQIGTRLGQWFEAFPELRDIFQSCTVIHAQEVCPSPLGGPTYVPCE